MIGRRAILRGGVGAGLGSLLSRWLERPALADAAPATRAKHVIVLWMNGGPSHIDTWDPKSGKTAGPHKAIKTSVPGLMISEHMPALARVAHKLAIVRGVTSKEGNHQRAKYLLHTGYAPNPTVEHPSIGGWVSKRLGETASGLPAFVSLNGDSHDAGFFGAEHGPFVVRDAGAMPTDLAPSVEGTRFHSRQTLLGGMEADFSSRSGDPKVTGRRDVYGKAERLMFAPSISAFDVSKEPESVSKAFGDSPFGRGCLTAVRLASAGVRFIEVTLDGWDTHKDNFGRTKRLMSQLDPAMSSLLVELEHRKLLDDTLVVWLGDFGRTPRINGDDGRDHHPAASSVVLVGGGIRTGIVHGETDADGANVVKDAVTVPSLVATIAATLGLDPEDTVMSPAGRPISLADHAAPVRALLR